MITDRINFFLKFFFFKFLGYCTFSLSDELENLLIKFHKKSCWEFDWDYMEIIDLLGENWHLYNNESSHPETWYVFIYSGL